MKVEEEIKARVVSASNCLHALNKLMKIKAVSGTKQI